MLRQAWANCTRCELGQRRINVQGNFVFGHGAVRGIMFVGEGPGKEEEIEGLPFVGKSGSLLRKVLMQLGLAPEDYYLTNTVCCRSCSPQADGAGQPIFRKNYKTKLMELAFKDEPPTPPQYLACLPRLHEEIYLVDPIVIVGLGAKACEALRGKSITITRDRGDAEHISIPGASSRPSVTKDHKWTRKQKGEVVSPMTPNEVRYHFIPTLHPAYVIRKLADEDEKSPFRHFVADIKKAIRTYETYMELVFGEVPSRRVDLDENEMHQQIQATDED
jgi:DNA polymerase